MAIGLEYNQVVITHYTTKEGGDWLEWKAGKLETRVTRVNNKTMQLNGVRFHALKLSNGLEFDALNGFRSYTPAVIKEKQSPGL